MMSPTDCNHETCVPIEDSDRVLCTGCFRKLCPHDWENDFCACTFEEMIERRERWNDA